jgi:pyruvate-formate lyase
MDTYLGPLFARDIDSGALSGEQALEIVVSLWRLIVVRRSIFNGRVIVGGMGRKDEASADRFASAAIEATRRVREIEPQLTLRHHARQNARLLAQALDVLTEGTTFPILYNDDVNVPAVAAAFDVPLEDAMDYVPHGCGEYVLAHRSFHTPSGVINLLEALLATLNDGRDPTLVARTGLALGSLTDYDDFESLFRAYARQVEYFVDALADQEALEYRVVGEQASFLYMSLLYDDCVARGAPIFAGGIRHLGGTLETYGNANVADALTAIKRFVYDEKSVGAGELLTALQADFGGHEGLRRKLTAAPKYGNDDPEADAMAIRVHDHVCRAVQNQRSRTRLDSYLVVIINNSANTTLGSQTGASPDGRRARTSLANGNNPAAGADRSGATAFLRSLVKLDPSIHAGAAQNAKFSRESLVSDRSKIEALLSGYFRSGGTQLMLTVVSRDELEAALRQPERYQHVLVRVGGFSARFVELPREVQLDILRRTLN